MPYCSMIHQWGNRLCMQAAIELSVCMCACLCVSKAAAIWEIDGRGRMETMSCGFFLLSALCFLSAPSLFSLILPSSFFPPKLKQIVNSFTFLFPPPPPPRLSSLSLALSHCHSSILVFRSKVYHSPHPKPPPSGLKKPLSWLWMRTFPTKDINLLIIIIANPILGFSHSEIWVELSCSPEAKTKRQRGWEKNDFSFRAAIKVLPPLTNLI